MYQLVVSDVVAVSPGDPRILLAGAVMGVVLYPLSRFSIFISLPAGGLTYLVAIFLIRAIEPEEWRLAQHGLLSRLRPNRAA